MREVLNATLAQELYDRGFTGWVTFAEEDYKRIEDRCAREFEKSLYNLFEDSEDVIKFNPDLLNTIPWKQIFSEELANTNLRINRNLDVGLKSDGTPMRQYSRGYAEYKLEKTGKTTVNLLVTGELRRSMVQNINTDEKTAELVFTGSHKNSDSGLKKSPKKRRK